MRAARAEIDLLINNPNYRAGRRLERGRLAKSLAESAKRVASGALAPFSSTGSDALLEVRYLVITP